MAQQELTTIVQVSGKGINEREFVDRLNANFDELYAGGGDGTPVAVTWDDVEGKPAVIGAGATATAARTAIGAGVGSSNLVIGTTASTAAAGNHNHAVTADAGSGLAAAANIQALAVALSARIKALEDAP